MEMTPKTIKRLTHFEKGNAKKYVKKKETN
jgi:hypothetical protein